MDFPPPDDTRLDRRTVLTTFLRLLDALALNSSFLLTLRGRAAAAPRLSALRNVPAIERRRGEVMVAVDEFCTLLSRLSSTVAVACSTPRSDRVDTFLISLSFWAKDVVKIRASASFLLACTFALAKAFLTEEGMAIFRFLVTVWMESSSAC